MAGINSLYWLAGIGGRHWWLVLVAGIQLIQGTVPLASVSQSQGQDLKVHRGETEAECLSRSDPGEMRTLAGEPGCVSVVQGPLGVPALKLQRGPNMGVPP